MNTKLLLASLLIFYPVAAVSSQTLLDISITCMALVWIGVGLKKGFRTEGRLNTVGAEWGFVAYVVVVICGFIFNASTEAPWWDSLIKFTWILNFYILIYAFSKNTFNLEKVLKVLCVLLLPLTIYSLISYWHGVDLITGRDNSTRITGLVNSSTYHAHGNAVIFVFLAAILLFTYQRLNRTWIFFCVASISLLGASIFLTLTRGIWLSIALSALIMASMIRWKRALQILGFLVVLFGILFVGFSASRERVIVPVSQDGSVKERLDLINVNLQMWREHPWLGIGHGENLRRNREYWDRPEWNKPQGYITSHAHNQYLNVLSTTGILGFITFMSFFTFFLWKNFKLLRKASPNKASKNYILLFACMWAQVEFWLACLTDVSFEYAKIRALLIMVWALVIALDKHSEKMTGEKL